MSDEIIRRLAGKKNKLEFINEERITNLNEVEEDEEETQEKGLESEEEEATPPEENPGGEETSSTIVSPRGSDIEDFDSEETPESEDEDEEYIDPDGGTEDPGSSDGANEFVNPLDNNYAVHHGIGEEVLLAYSDGTKSRLKGVIDGYDTEGFYRIKWTNGLTTNGITDLALADLIEATNESRCVCGSTQIITESNKLICDICGRVIKESREVNEESLDSLTKLDKSRPKGKRMIRSEAHPISTADKPSISEVIKKAFKDAQPIREQEEDEDYADPFYKLQTIAREFWTRREELAEDIEELGYSVDEINAEYVIVTTEDDALLVPIGGTSRTMTLDLDRARKI